jgi:HEAT repeat protein
MTRRMVVAAVLALSVGAASLLARAQAPADPAELVRQLGQFEAAISPGVQSNTGRPLPAEQQREALFIKLRAIGESAAPALRRGLADANVQIRRNVALYLSWEGGNYAKHAPQPLDLKPFLPQLVIALRDDDARVQELSAQALAHLGGAGVTAVPDLLRLLASPSEGLRNSACIGLAGIGPAASDALPALRRALNDPSDSVRRFAQRAIDKITVNRGAAPRGRP